MTKLEKQMHKDAWIKWRIRNAIALKGHGQLGWFENSQEFRDYRLAYNEQELNP